jgi:hypothetical protein
MSDDPTKEADEAATTHRPEDWNRNEMGPDRGDDQPATTSDDAGDAPDWNEGQMAEEHADGSRTAGPSDEEIAESAHGLSGGGTNPGGGERWAERDDESSED